MAGLSASLDARLSEVFASPIFVGSPLLTVLDEILLEFDAARLDAELVGNVGKVFLSSALERERSADTRWPVSSESDSEPAEDIRKPPARYDLDPPSWWEAAPEKSDAPKSIRPSMKTCTTRLVIDFASCDPPLKFAENNEVLKRIYLWIPRQDDFAKKHCGSIKKALFLASKRKVSDIGMNVQHLLGRLRGKALDDELRTAFATFDKWVRRLLLADLSETLTDDQNSVIKNYAFFNEFFWVTKPPRPHDLRDKLACVKPVFLSEQLPFLTAEFDQRLELHDQLCGIFFTDWIDSYSSNSNTLFGAFPADTSMSVVIPHWTKEQPFPYQFNPSRQLFKEITSEAHKTAAKDLPSNVTDFDMLFSVPVLHGSAPLFTVTMFLSKSFSSDHRASLASRIRSLGGLFLMRLEAGHLRWSQNLERELEKQRLLLSERSQTLRTTTQLSKISSRVVSPLVQVSDNSEDLQFHMRLDDAKALKNQLDEFLGWPEKKRKEETETLKSADLRNIVESAIVSTQHLCVCNFESSGMAGDKWMVRCNEKVLTGIFAEVIFAITRLPGFDCNISVDFRQPDEANRIQVVFHFACTSATPQEIRGIMRAKSQVEYYTPLLQLIDARFKVLTAREAMCCAVELPIEEQHPRRS